MGIRPYYRTVTPDDLATLAEDEERLEAYTDRTSARDGVGILCWTC